MRTRASAATGRLKPQKRCKSVGPDPGSPRGTNVLEKDENQISYRNARLISP